MKHAVIYARYSSDKQDEASIDAQVRARRECQRRYEIVRKRRRNFVVFRRQGGDKIKRFLAQKECSQFAASSA